MMTKIIEVNGKKFELNIVNNSVVQNKNLISFLEEFKDLLNHIIKKYYRFKLPLYSNEDVQQELRLALLEAIIDYDATKKTPFKSFTYTKFIQKIYQLYRKAHIDLINKYCDTTGDTLVIKKKVCKNKYEKAQYIRNLNSAVTAYNLLYAHYISEFESNQDNNRSSLENSIYLSCCIDEDALFGYCSDFNSDD